MEKTSRVSIGVFGLFQRSCSNERIIMARWIRRLALVATACVLSTAQAKAAVIYSVGGVLEGAASISLPYQFSVTSADFIDAPTQFTPGTSECTVAPHPTIVSCQVSSMVIFFPGMFIGFDSNNAPGYLPSRIDWAVSVTGFNGTTNVTATIPLSAVFGVPYTLGGTAFESPGTYGGYKPSPNLLGPPGGFVALLKVSGSPDVVTPAVPEPALLLLLGSGAFGVLARTRRRRHL